ncbi:MAG: hypothetical protein AMJ54_16360 [Deltaproteobacteria bacterium SG8_13]|nr:MAG: hypothetical protein AMJ54_16360 [Deltaproteobacteria bacterium SG8_13]
MEEDYDGAEKRKFKRVVFSAGDEVIGVVTWPEHGEEPFAYRVSDIGAGGMRFILTREKAPQIIDFNDTLHLREIKGKSQLEFVAGVALEVRWVIEHEMFEHMVIGCEFVNIEADVQKQIDAFVETELAAKNQDS